MVVFALVQILVIALTRLDTKRFYGFVSDFSELKLFKCPKALRDVLFVCTCTSQSILHVVLFFI